MSVFPISDPPLTLYLNENESFWSKTLNEVKEIDIIYPLS